MTKVCLTIESIYIRSTILLYRREVVLPLLITHVHNTLFCEDLSIAAITGRHYTVEHIHTPFNSLKKIFRLSHTHEVAGFIFWQNIIYKLYHLIHLLCWLTYR